MMGILLAAAVAAAPLVSYDCTLNTPASLTREGDKVSLRTLKFPQVKDGDWKFRIEIRGAADDRTAIVDWPSDPIQIAGEHPILSTSAGSFAFVSAGVGCTFTETGCVTTVHVVDEKADSEVVVMPTALWSDSKANTREPFIAIIEGRCSRSGASK